MNEILQPYLVELLELVKTTGSFIVGELPAISKEIIMWGIIKSILSPLVWIFLTVGFAVITVKIKNSKENIFETDMGIFNSYIHITHVIFFWICLCCAIFFGIIAFDTSVSSVLSVFKVIFAPRLFLIEQIKLML